MERPPEATLDQVERAKQGIQEVIVYCKANPDAKVVDAVDAYVKKVQQAVSELPRDFAAAASAVRSLPLPAYGERAPG